MSSLFFNVYMDTVMKEVKIEMRKMGVRFIEKGREWRFPGLLYANNLILSGISEEDLRTMVGCFSMQIRAR